VTRAVATDESRPQASTDPWTVLRMMRWSAEYLESKGVVPGRLDAELLLAHALGVERLALYLEFDRPLTRDELDRFKPVLLRRARREPLQYILGRTGFRDLALCVDRRALIPRSETEGLVQNVLDWSRSEQGPLDVMDVGTGCGAIALSLASEGEFRSVIASDVSEDALALARENAAALGVQGVDFRAGALYEPLAPGERVDIVVSNPPYVANDERDALAPEIRAWEPERALFAGDDGLDVIAALLSDAPSVLRPGGLIALEIGAEQGSKAVALATSIVGLADASVRRDLAGRDRYLLARARKSK
jgi:release factor glutamine methyltransferase